jgi:hypothetical protein
MAYQLFKPRPANAMKSNNKLPALILLTLFCTGHAEAQELGAWTLGQSQAANGAVIHSASLTSSTLITSAAIDYPAIYTISCQTGEPTKWMQQLRLDDALSSRGEIELIATVDKKLPREEFWIVTDNKRLLTRENLPDITELRTAKTLKLEWNWGWSWLWLSDEAHFELGDAEAVIFTLAKNCGIEVP